MSARVRDCEGFYRRDFLKLAAATLAGCATPGGAAKARVVVIGAGFGGLSVAETAEALHVSPETVMSAAAGDALVRAGVARRSGRVGLWTPFPNTRLPFERLTPVPGARLLGLPLSAPAARITEAKMKALDAAAAAGTSTAEDDADAITVTAEKKRRGTPWILVGRDVLDRCTRIELDRPAKAWRLTCDF